jgi:fimbrial chaperone protein
MRRFLGVLALLCAAFSSFALERAHASGFEVSPITLTLSANAKSAMLTVTNQSAEPLRFHVTAAAWDQRPDGEMVLTPTTDIMFFPAMLTLNPQEARNLRVGVNVKPGATEKAYRVFVQELPRLVTADNKEASAVGILTKMGVPVFVQPEAPKTAPTLAGLALRENKLTFAVGNTGTEHFRSETITIRAKDGAKELFVKELDGWYVLAGRSTSYGVALPPEVCTGLKAVEVVLTSDKGKAAATLGNAHCTP